MKETKQRLRNALTILGVNLEEPIYASLSIIGAIAVYSSVTGDQKMVKAANQLENELAVIARPNAGSSKGPSI